MDRRAHVWPYLIVGGPNLTRCAGIFPNGGSLPLVLAVRLEPLSLDAHLGLQLIYMPRYILSEGWAKILHISSPDKASGTDLARGWVFCLSRLAKRSTRLEA